MTAMPAISVLLPVKNAAATLDAALASVLGQTHTAIEVIAVDDHSSDASAAILARTAARDRRVRVLAATGRGATQALNQALAAATASYVARQDADDLSSPERFARQTAFLDATPNVCAVGCGAMAIDEEGREVGPLPTRHGTGAVRDGIVSVRATPVHGAMMMRREALEAVGGYRDAFLRCQDYDLWLRLLERWDMDNLSERLYRWRLTPTSTYGARRVNQLMYGGVAKAFAVERQQFGTDSYHDLDRAGGDLERFAAGYRLEALLRATWGQLLLRGVNDSRLAHRHLRIAVRRGRRDPLTLIFYAWTTLGLPWPGGRPLRPAPHGAAVPESDR
jgi:glycosyltransferase involved in cell wall biosynthesis